MKKLLLFIIPLLLGACAPKTIVVPDTYGSVMINSFEKNFSIDQFDSIAIADTIPNDLSKWKTLYLKDFEGEPFAQYLYIKRLGQEESIYRLEKVGTDSVFITKRITKK